MYDCGASTFTNGTANLRELAEYRCRCWTCETCAPIRRWLLKRKIAEGRPTRFITLTLPANTAHDPDAGAARLVHAWRMIVQEIKRRQGKHALEYLCVFEETKKHTPHIHIAYRGAYIAQRWLSRKMAQYANAPIVDIRRVRSPKVLACYLAKYLCKAPIRYAGCKRYWCTRHWSLALPVKFKPTDKQLKRWVRLDGPIAWWAAHYLSLGYQVTSTAEHRVTVTGPPITPLQTTNYGEHRS